MATENTRPGAVENIRAGLAPAAEFQFHSRDGLSIFCSRWTCHGPVRGVIQIAHGMGEHVGRYSELISVLVAAGLTVYGNDHRGHGRTAPADVLMVLGL